MNDDSVAIPPQEPPWLLLIHQIPPKPDYFRVKVRRRLRRLGARPLKNSVYVLPRSDDALEDFQWLAREIVAEGGDAMVCEATFVTGISDPELEAMFTVSAASFAPRSPAETAAYQGRTWVTRQGVGIDRMASAWLIRRFIDGAARFKFVPARGVRPAPGEVRFDMYDAEFTHDGAACTFEVLIDRFGLRDRALRVIAEIVHDVDCKEEKFGRAEAAGVALVIDGIARAHPADDDRLARAAALFDDVYGQLQRAR